MKRLSVKAYNFLNSKVYRLLGYKGWRMVMGLDTESGLRLMQYVSILSWQYRVSDIITGKQEYSHGTDTGGGLTTLELWLETVDGEALAEAFPKECAELTSLLTKCEQE